MNTSSLAGMKRGPAGGHDKEGSLIARDRGMAGARHGFDPRKPSGPASGRRAWLRRRPGALALYRASLACLILVLGGGGILVHRLLAPEPPDGPFTAVVVGQHHTCATSEKGSVYCWGSQARGQAGHHNGKAGSIEVQTYPAKVEVPGSVRDLTAGALHTCVVNDGGDVYCWGANDAGQSGASDARVASHPTRVPVKNAVTVRAGAKHTCAVTKEGKVYCWGDNRRGQVLTTELDWLTPPEKSFSRPQEVELPSRAVDVMAGHEESCALMDDGSLICWSAAYVEPMPSGDDAYAGAYAGPGKVVWSRYMPGKVTEIASGGDPGAGSSLCARVDSGGVYCWAGGLGDGDRFDVEAPGVVRVSTGEVPASVSLASGYLMAPGGRIGHVPVQRDLDQAGRGKKTAVKQDPRIFRVRGRAVALSSGYSQEHGCAITSSGQTYCWGRNDYGQLGNGSVVSDRDDEYASTVYPVRVWSG